MERQDAQNGRRPRLSHSNGARGAAGQSASEARQRGPTPPAHPSAQQPASPDLDLPTLRLPTLSTPSTSHTPSTGPGPHSMPRGALRSRALVPRTTTTGDGEHAVLVVPATRAMRTAIATAPVPRGRRVFRWSRPVTFALMVVTVVVALAFGAHEAQQGDGSTPPPSGRAPWYAFAGSVAVATVAPPPPIAIQQQRVAVAGEASPLEPCHDSTRFLASISQWSVPPGCYSLIYTPNPANYISRPGFGFCNWWIRVTHPNHPDITENLSYPRGTDPAAGAPIFFDGNEQGAESIGHWAQAVAVSPDHYWVLISEMNFAWRGAGFGKLDYRYIHVSPHVHFVYIFS